MKTKHENKKEKSYKKYILIIIILGILITIAGCTTNNNKKNTENTIKTQDLYCPDCNIIFLNIELLRADYVGIISKEHGENLTPNIDKFFEKGIIFTDTSAPAGETIVSNIAVLTNTDPYIIRDIALKNYSENGVEYMIIPREYNTNDGFSEFKNIGQQLQDQGYYTVNINEGWQSGWGTFMDKGFDIYLDERFKDIPSGFATWVFTTTNQMLPVLKYKSSSENQKFFLLFHGDRLHSSPSYFPVNRTRISDPDIQYIQVKDYYLVAYDLLARTGEVIKSKGEASEQTQLMTAEEFKTRKEKSEKMYIQQLKFVDDELGKIFKTIEENNLTQNTIIVLYANHGDGLYNNNIKGHGVVYQSCIHVPLLIRHPNIKKQIQINETVALIDLTPTIYNMINKTYNNTNTITEAIKQKKVEKEIYGISLGEYLRKGDMKLIIQPDNTHLLFNITADPHELKDIAKEQSETVKELNDILTAHKIQVLKKT